MFSPHILPQTLRVSFTCVSTVGMGWCVRVCTRVCMCARVYTCVRMCAGAADRAQCTFSMSSGASALSRFTMYAGTSGSDATFGGSDVVLSRERILRMHRSNCWDLIQDFGEVAVDVCPNCTNGVQDRGEQGVDCGVYCVLQCPGVIDTAVSVSPGGSHNLGLFVMRTSRFSFRMTTAYSGDSVHPAATVLSCVDASEPTASVLRFEYVGPGTTDPFHFSVGGSATQPVPGLVNFNHQVSVSPSFSPFSFPFIMFIGIQKQDRQDKTDRTRQTDRQTDRHTDRQTDKQTDSSL